MSFYLDRLEAARRQQRMLSASAAAGCAPPPRAWPYFRYYPYQHAAALLPRSPTLPVPPLHGSEEGVRQAHATWRGGSVAAVARSEAAPMSAGASAVGWNAVAACGAGGFAAGDGARDVASSVAPAPAEEEAGGLAGDCVPGVTGSVAPAPAREEAGRVGGGEMRNKKCLLAPAPDASCPPPKRRAAPARRWFPPGCGRDAAAARLVGPGECDSRPEPARGGGGQQESTTPPAPTTPHAAASASAAGPAPCSSAPAAHGAAGTTTDGAHHCPGSALENSSEAPGKNSVTAADAFCNDTASSQGGVVGPAGSGNQSLKSNENLVRSVRLLPKPSKVSAYSRFPPGCRRRGAPLLAGGGSSQVRSPLSEEAVPEERDDDMEIVAPICSGTEDVAAKREGLEEGEIPSEVQESPSATLLSLHDEDTTCRHGASSSSEEIIGNTSWRPSEENKSGASGNSCNVAAESLAQGLPKEHLNGERVVSECATADTASSGGVAAAAGVSDVVGDTMKTKKVMFTPRKSVKPPKSIQKPALNNIHQCMPFSKETEEDADLGMHSPDGIEDDTDEFTKDPAVQDPMSADKCPGSWTKGKEAATFSNYFGPKKKVNGKEDSNSNLLDDDILKAIAVQESMFENGPQNADARSRVKMLCSTFESICRAIVQSAEHRSLKVRRIDLAADKLIRKLPGFTKLGSVVGAVPGVEVGDEFLYRVQLALVGLHRPYQGGIDATRDERGGALIAISVVASGGYPDELSCPGELVYTGSGKDGCDQKLEHGNLALRNCVERKVPVRVIHGFKGLNREGGSHSRAREITTFTYDGLYRVVDCWREGRPGSKVFKYKLQRIPGQPELPLHTAKFARKKDI